MSLIARSRLNIWLKRLAIAALLLPSFASAVEVKNIFTVQILVKSQDKRERDKAVLAGLKEVLVRKSGTEAVLQTYEVQQVFSKATRFLQRFEYQQLDQPVEQVGADGVTEMLFYRLSMTYDPVLVEDLIQSAGAPLWGNNRPAVLLWIAVEDADKRYLIADDSELYEEVDWVARESERRAVPLLLPLNDLEDQAVIQFADVWGRFVAPIKNASLRYGTDIVVAGKVQSLMNEWQGKFVYINDDIEQLLDLRANSKRQLLTNLVNQLTELMCQKYCVTRNIDDAQLVSKILVGGISGFAGFKQVEAELQKLSAIRKVEVAQVDGPYVLFHLQLLGDIEAVTQSLELKREFVPMSEDEIKAYQSRQQKQADGAEQGQGPANAVDTQQEGLKANPTLDLTNTLELVSPSPDSQPQAKPQDVESLYYWWRP